MYVYFQKNNIRVKPLSRHRLKRPKTGLLIDFLRLPMQKKNETNATHPNISIFFLLRFTTASAII